MKSKGEQVRARKRFRAAGGGSYRTVTLGDWPGGRNGFGYAPTTNDNQVQTQVELDASGKVLRGDLGQVFPVRTYKLREPERNPEVLSRQVLRRMLRDKAKQDIFQQYGRASHGLFVGYVGFSRRGRRNAMRKISWRWYQQIRENLMAAGNGKQEPRNRGFVKDIMRRIFKAPQNTLAASAVKA